MERLIQPTRRGLITGLGALFIAAPAIVRATSIMPVKAIKMEPLLARGLIAVDVSAGGLVTGITVLSGGSGYTTPPLIEVADKLAESIANVRSIGIPTRLLVSMDYAPDPISKALGLPITRESDDGSFALGFIRGMK